MCSIGTISRVAFLIGVVLHSTHTITQTSPKITNGTAAELLWTLSGVAVEAKRNEYNLRNNRSTSTADAQNLIDNEARNNDINYRQSYYFPQKYPYKHQEQYSPQQNYQQGQQYYQEGQQYYQQGQQNYQQGQQNYQQGQNNYQQGQNNYEHGQNNYNKYPQQFEQGYIPPGPGPFPSGAYPQTVRPGFYPPPGGPGPYPGQFGRPPLPTSFMDALGSIAENDDLHCVPRLLCEITSGSYQGGGRQSPSFLPSFINMDSLLGILTAFDGAQANPLLMFGRAALLGYNSKGNTRSCSYAYPKCPQDADRLVTYLNNHNGGFFRYFNGLNLNQQNPGGFPQNFGIPPNSGYPPFPIYPPNPNFPANLGDPPNLEYPPNPPYPQNSNYPSNSAYSPNSIYPSKPGYPSNGGGYSPYLGYPSQSSGYQQNVKPSNTNYGYVPKAGYQQQNRIYPQKQRYKYGQKHEHRFPASSNPIKYPNNYQQRAVAEQRIQTKPGPIVALPNINKYGINQYGWRFPVFADHYNNIDSNNFIFNGKRTSKGLAFPERQRDAYSTNQNQKQVFEFPKPLPNQNLIPMLFPDRTGTGDLLLDADKFFIATENRPNAEHVFYLKHFSENNRRPDLNLPGNDRGSKSLTFPSMKEGRTYND